MTRLALIIALFAASAANAEPPAHKGYPVRPQPAWLHLANDPPHKGKFDIRWIQQLTDDEATSLCADDNEGLVDWGFAVKAGPGPSVLSAERPVTNFALAPGDGRTLSLAQLRLPGVDGETIRFTRSTPMAFLDARVADCHVAGKPYTLLCKSGDAPRPWEDANVHAWELTAAKLGARYAVDDLCIGVHWTGCTSASEEPHWTITEAIFAAEKRLGTAWARAFPRQVIIKAIAGDDPSGMRRIIDLGLIVAPHRILIKQNAWSAKMRIDAPQNELLVYAGQHGASIGFEPLCSSGESRFGGTWAQATAKGSEVAKRGRVGIGYQAVYPPDLGRLR